MTIQTNAIETPPTYTRGKVEGSENRGWISMKLKVLKSLNANVDMTLVEGHLKLSLRIVHPRTKSQPCRFSNVSEISVPC